MDTFRNKKNLWTLYEKEVPHSRFCDPACGVSPAEKLSPEHLQLLRNAFTCSKAGLETQEHKLKGSNRGTSEERGLTFEEFWDVLKSVIGPNIEDTWCKRFFYEVDISCTGQIKWQQLCSYLLLEYTERQRASNPTAALLEAQPQIRHCSHNKREPTVRVVALSHPPPLRYISVSKGGQITAWNSSLHTLKTLGLAGDPTEEVANTRRFRGWTTDAVYMGNVHKIAIATDCRDLRFVTISSNCLLEEIHLYGFRSVPTCLCYWYDVQGFHSKSLEQPPLLLLGDEKGGVHLMWFLNSSKGLFKKPSKRDKGPQRIFFQDLGEHSDMVSYQHIPSIHQEPITRVMFEPSANVIMTSSESNTTSVVFMNVSLKQEPYIWKFNQGAKCFDYNASLQLMVTGGSDRKVRLWSQYVTSSPVATLPGHHTTVLDVAIYQHVGQIFSYSRDAELRVWDISTHQCLKVLRLQFPCLQPGRIPEHGNFPFLLLSPPLPDEMQPHLVVACKDYLAVLNLSEKRRGGGGWLTDEEFRTEFKQGPYLSCALYNPTLRQVVTGHADSSVFLWDVETGRRRLYILNAHGEEVLSSMALDSSHRRLITGARNGTIKVWNLLNGLNLHKLEPVTNSEVTGLTCLHDNHLLAVGWNQCITQYSIAGDKDLKVRADMSWKSSGVHKSDILAVCQCSALSVVATASYDGEVVIWSMETQGPMLHLQRGTQARSALPVDSILFLQHRAGRKQLRNKGVLVSSQGGWLCFWSITDDNHSYGHFYAPEQPGERVLSLNSDQSKNTFLVSGDTTGSLQIWDISSFAVDIQPEATCEQPPLLLQSWRAHKRALICVEVLEVFDRLFVLTASVDGSAGLWTEDGNHVGFFGQEVTWNIADPGTYHRNTRNNLREERRTEDENMEGSDVQNQVPDPTSRDQTSQEEWCSEASSTQAGVNDHEQPQQPMYSCEDLCQTVALCYERRGLFEDIDHSNRC
ncbi:WD repeat-containing protein on Y chromosome [Astatotilapia calliptera]|uniref:WD repeat-containing protein on Y chromosome n=1 Tax=Astatotilapia calliptera TaxID=8154 RepID=UPI000E41A0AA|nr:WD repeat-containing protein on Y chromosome-like [Astatotilapia calliptera]